MNDTATQVEDSAKQKRMLDIKKAKQNVCLCGCAVLSQPEVVVLDPQDAVLAHQSNKKLRKMKRRAWASDTRESGARALVTLHVCARDL